MTSILVTGGAGYVGVHSVVELVNSGYNLVIIDNLCNASAESLTRAEQITGKKVHYHNVDLLDKPALSQIFSTYTISSVIHFAGLKAVGESVQVPLKYYRVNVGGTLNLLECMKEAGVNHIVFSSSATVYGEPQYLPLDEKHPGGIGMTNPYGKTKFHIEEIIRDVCKSDPEFCAVILRYFNPIGAHPSGLIGEDPRGAPNNLMPYVSQVAIGRRPFVSVYGADYDTPDGTGVRDYIHVVDLAKGHVSAVKKLDQLATSSKDARCLTVNLGTGRGCSVLEMIKGLEKASGKEIPHKLCPRRDGDIASCYSDASFALSSLGWKAELTLDDMCRDLWNWQSKNPMGYATAESGSTSGEAKSVVSDVNGTTNNLVNGKGDH